MTPPAVFPVDEKVIPIDSVPRSCSRGWEKEAEAKGFSKALFLVHSMRRGTTRERQTAIENWVAADTISADEKAALYEFYGWERAP